MQKSFQSRNTQRGLRPQPDHEKNREPRNTRKKTAEASRAGYPPEFSCFSTLEELDVLYVEKVPRFHGAVAPGKPLVAALEELDVGSVGKVPGISDKF